MRTPLSVAAAQPGHVAGDLATSVLAHVEAIRLAKADLVVFPELSLTGYDLSAAPVAASDSVVQPLITACAREGSVALVGAPVADAAGGRSIGMLLVRPDAAEVVYRKSFLSDAEATRFKPGDGPRAIDVGGWRIGLGICKDTGIGQHISDTAALGVDAYAAGVVHHAHEVDEQERRAIAIAAACEAYVVLAGFAGPTGEGYESTAGRSSVWSPAGERLACADDQPGSVAWARIR